MMSDNYIKDICRTQERLFRAASKKHFNMQQFAELFMNSDLANLDLDCEYSPFNASFASELLEILGYPTFPYEESDEDIAGWIGYLYRLIQIKKGISSKEVYQKFPYKKMEEYWIFGHTMSDDAFIDRIF